jgi:serine/threonine protein kinase
MFIEGPEEGVMNQVSPATICRLIEAYKKMEIAEKKKPSMGRLVEYWEASQKGMLVASKTSTVATDVISRHDGDPACEIKEVYAQGCKDIAEEESKAKKKLEAAMKERIEMETKLNLGDRSAEKLHLFLEFREKKQLYCDALSKELNTELKALEKQSWKNLSTMHQQVPYSQTQVHSELDLKRGAMLDKLGQLCSLGFDVENIPDNLKSFVDNDGSQYSLAIQRENKAKERLQKVAKNKEILSRIEKLIQEKQVSSQVSIEGTASLKTQIDKGKEHVTDSSKTIALVPAQMLSTKPCQAVYSLANGMVLLVKNETGYTIALKVPPDRYIKLRNPAVLEEEPLSMQDMWLAVGKPAVFYVYIPDLCEQIGEHFDPKYGKFSDIEKAYKNFEKDASSCVEELAVLPTSLKQGKLAVEMNDTGDFRIVVRKEFAIGGNKRVYDETVRSFGEKIQRIARAKLGDKKFSEDPEDLRKLKEEIEFSQHLQAAGVPHILVAKAGKGQNINKVRVEMPFIQGGDLYSMVKNEPEITPVVVKKRLTYMLHIAEAVQGMQIVGFAHCDLKLQNFLFDKDNDSALLSDFGGSSVVKSISFPGTYPAPECASIQPGQTVKVPATPENDCWAFGIALFSMLYGRKCMEYTYSAAFNKGREQIKKVGKEICKYLENKKGPAYKLIQQLLSEESWKRPSMHAVVAQLKSLINVM